MAFSLKLYSCAETDWQACPHGTLLYMQESRSARASTLFPSPVLITGMPGRMASAAAERIMRGPNRLPGFTVLEAAVSTKRYAGMYHTVYGREFFLTPNFHNLCDVLAVDYTSSDSALQNAEMYAAEGISFVMGTTNDAESDIRGVVKESGVSAVVAPNMAQEYFLFRKQIHDFAKEHPHALAGWTFAIRESHQAGKRDVSGTARALSAELAAMRAIEEREIETIRDPEVQTRLGVKNLNSHAYHWVTLRNSVGKGRVFELKIDGLQPYAEGTVKALTFLQDKIKAGSRGEVFGIEDVFENS